jgi:hypothetical protein
MQEITSGRRFQKKTPIEKKEKEEKNTPKPCSRRSTYPASRPPRRWPARARTPSAPRPAARPSWTPWEEEEAAARAPVARRAMARLRHRLRFRLWPM